jgi:FG-GAP-like repeat
MYRTSFLTPSLSILSVITFLLTPLGVVTAQVNSTEVTTLKFAQHELPLGTAPYNNGGSSAIVAGDFNNDGILDVVTVNGTPSQPAQISFWAGLGGGKFSTTPINTNLNLGQQPFIGGPAFAADFNSDGKLDLAISAGLGLSSQTGPVTILLGNGNGTFTLGQSFTPSTNSGLGNASAIALADFNGDHIPDIAVSDGFSGYTWIYLGKGNGTFTLADTQESGGNSVVAGDFNADGKQDVAFASNYGSGDDTVGVFLGNGNGTLGAPVLATVSGVTGLAVGDFYNNRIQSLAALSGVGPPDENYTTYLVTLQYSDGQLQVGPQNQVTAPVIQGPVYVEGGDLNGDFIFDVIITGGGYYEGPFSQYMLGNGNGTFQAPQSSPYDTQGTTFVYPVIRDLNLESRHDVAMAWSSVVDDNGGGDVLINQNATRNCDPPPANALGVNICTPTSGASIGKTYTFKGAGNAFNGIAKRMELWIDGTKVGQDLEDQLNITTTLEAGTHTASFVVVDSFDSYTSKSVTFTTR